MMNSTVSYLIPPEKVLCSLGRRPQKSGDQRSGKGKHASPFLLSIVRNKRAAHA